MIGEAVRSSVRHGRTRKFSTFSCFSSCALLIYGIRPDLMRDRKRRSKTKNGVFRSGFFDQKKIYCSSQDKIAFFSDRKIQIEKRRFSFSISHKIGSNSSII